MVRLHDEDSDKGIKSAHLSGRTGIEVKIMVRANRYFGIRPAWLMALFVAMSLIVVLGCGGGGDNGDEPSDSAPVATEQSSAAGTGASDSAGDSPGTDDSPVVELDTSVPLGSQVVAAVEPAAGSDEAAILEAFRIEIRAINLEDWDGFTTICDPRLAIPWTPLQVKIAYAQNVALLAPAATYNRRNAKIQLNGDGTATVTSDTYSDDSLVVADVVESWIEVDGGWYFNEYFCHGGNTKTK